MKTFQLTIRRKVTVNIERSLFVRTDDDKHTDDVETFVKSLSPIQVERLLNETTSTDAKLETIVGPACICDINSSNVDYDIRLNLKEGDPATRGGMPINEEPTSLNRCNRAAELGEDYT